MFEWDEARARGNIIKHGVGFDLASRIFEGPVLTAIDGYGDYGELREISIGVADGIVVLTVVHTDRAGRTRIISARKATRSERERYGEALRKGLVS
jgi:uncharacterized DUF497 family protein